MKKWHNISIYKRIANVNVGKRRIDNWQILGTCLKTAKEKPGDCVKKGCIIGMLIEAVNKK